MIRHARSGLSLMVLTAASCLLGCGSVGSPALRAKLMSIPAESREQLHIHLVNSPLDVPMIGRLPAVAGFLRDSGIPETDFHFVATGRGLADLICAAREDDPAARIVLLGWSGGSLPVWDACETLEERDQRVDLVVYLDSNWIVDRVADRGHPLNVDRTVMIYRANNTPPADVPNPVLYQIPSGNHFAIPAHDASIEALVDELVGLAMDDPSAVMVTD